MECRRIKLFQSSCNYRVENTYHYHDTYSLPNLSMVKGMLYAAISAKDKNAFYDRTISDLQIGISGTYDGTADNLQWMRRCKSGNDSQYIATVALLLGMSTIIHVSGNDEFIEALDKSISSSYLSLGRHDDVVRLDAYGAVTLKNVTASIRSGASYELSHSAYFNIDKADFVAADNRVWLSTTYHVEGGVRYFKKKPVIQVSKGTVISEGSWLHDGDSIVDLIRLT